MKALTVQQPWAWTIVHGGKDVENRTQAWSYRGPLAIHAGMRDSARGLADAGVQAAMERARFLHLAYGFVIGVVDLVDVHPQHDGCCASPWAETSYVEHGGRERRQLVHLVLEQARPLDEPIPCVGRLGLWTPPADVLDQLQAVRRG